MSIASPKIMIVEDENLLLLAISKKMRILGIEPVSCVSAEQALDYLNVLPELPDAIWLDFHLGGMDGLEFMKKLKENPIWINIPVFVISNSASPEKVNEMLALGAVKYILKAEHRLDEIIDSIKVFVTQGI
jgi:CheY-like chemotaxis protein